MNRKSVIATALTLGALVVVAGCGSSSSSTSTSSQSAGGSASTGTGSASKQPIQIMVVGRYTNPEFSYPEMWPSAQAAATALNANGGINGRPVELVKCDDQGDPNVGAKCARQAASGHTPVVLLTFEVSGELINPILQAANIPAVDIFPVVPTDASTPVLFPTTGGLITQGAASQGFMHQVGCSQTGATTLAGDTGAGLPYVGMVTASKTLGVAKPVLLTSPEVGDQTPTIAAAVQKKVDCLYLNEDATQILGSLSAATQQAPNKKFVAPTLSFASFGSIPTSANGMYLVSPTVSPFDTSNAEVQEFRGEMQKYAPSAPISAWGLLTWASAKVLFGALKTVTGPVTNTSVLAALQKYSVAGTSVSDSSTTLLGAFSFAKESTVPHQPRLFNGNSFFYQFENKSIKLTSPKPINGLALLEGQS